jgi:hypothetical protein
MVRVISAACGKGVGRSPALPAGREDDLGDASAASGVGSSA